MTNFLVALGFLTKIPIPKHLIINEKDLAKSLVFFPVVGFLLGVVLIILNAFFELFLPMPVVNLLLIASLILLTGGLHLDGLADTVDGLSSKNKDKDEILRIMREPAIGAMGAMALIIVLGLKWETLNNIPPRLKDAALILMCSASRWSQVFAARISKYARPAGGLGRPFIGNAGKMGFNFATALTALMFLMFFPLKGFIVFVLLALAAWGFIKYINKRIGGMTGDTIGALSEMTEIAALLSILIIGRI